MPEYCQRCNIEHDSQELGCWRLTCLDSKTPAPSFICHFFEPGKATYVMLCFYKKAVVKIHCDYTNTTAGLALGHMETSWGIWSSRKPTDTHYRPHVRDEETEVQRGLKSLAQVMGSGWNRIIWLHSLSTVPVSEQLNAVLCVLSRILNGVSLWKKRLVWAKSATLNGSKTIIIINKLDEFPIKVRRKYKIEQKIPKPNENSTKQNRAAGG